MKTSHQEKQKAFYSSFASFSIPFQCLFFSQNIWACLDLHAMILGIGKLASLLGGYVLLIVVIEKTIDLRNLEKRVSLVFSH